MDQRHEMHGSDTGDAWIRDMRCMDQIQEMHGYWIRYRRCTDHRQEMYESETGDV